VTSLVHIQEKKNRRFSSKKPASFSEVYRKVCLLYTQLIKCFGLQLTVVP
jgi:hypothetical protein